MLLEMNGYTACSPRRSLVHQEVMKGVIIPSWKTQDQNSPSVEARQALETGASKGHYTHSSVPIILL